MSFREYLTETSYTKILSALRGDTPHIMQMAILTAQNPLSIKLSAEENNKRNKDLLNQLRHANYRGWPIKPQWIVGKFGNLEDSFFIPHIDRETAIKLAAQYGQQSVIWGRKILDEEPFVRFEYLRTLTDQEPVDPASYQSTQTRDVVIASQKAQSHSDNFSAKPFPKSEIDKRTGEPVPIRKFVIPFFDDRYAQAKYKTGKREIETEDIVSFVASELPDTPQVKAIVEEIKREEANLALENRLPKWYWELRGSLGISLQKLREAVK